MSLKYEPTSEPLHISVECRRGRRVLESRIVWISRPTIPKLTRRVCRTNPTFFGAGKRPREADRWAQIDRERPNVKRFRGGLVFKAHRLLYHPTLGLRVIKKKRKRLDRERPSKVSSGTTRQDVPESRIAWIAIDSSLNLHGALFKAHRLVYHSTLGSRVTTTTTSSEQTKPGPLMVLRWCTTPSPPPPDGLTDQRNTPKK